MLNETKFFIKLIITIALFGALAWACGGYADADWNEDGSLEVQEELWDLLINEFDNPIAAAAVMGNVAVESNYCPWIYCRDYEVEDDYIKSKEYVDGCNKGKFVWCWRNVVPGFGLFQFSTNAHMENLWNLAEEQGVPVYDVQLQTEYMLSNFKNKQPKAYQALAESTDLVDATEIFRSFAEGSYCSVETMKHRTNKAIEAYEKFTGEEYQGEIYIPMFNGGSMWHLKFERRTNEIN